MLSSKPPKYNPGYYSLNNVGLLQIEHRSPNSYLVSLVYSYGKGAAAGALALGGSIESVVIPTNKFEIIINTYGKELIPIPNSKAEVLELLYGSKSA
jgi:hypothetical protein